jgi:SNF2 family DNA or RNA helicase
VIGVTGTPILNRPNDLWCLLQNLDLTKDTFGTWENFMSEMGGRLVKLYGDKFITQWDSEKITENANKLLVPVMIRHTKEEVINDIPDKIRNYIRIPVENKKDLTILDNWLEEMRNSPTGDFQPNENLFQLRKRQAKAKLPYVIEILDSIEEEDEGPVLVFSCHRDPIDQLANRPGWTSITGDTPGHIRETIANDFQVGKYRGIALTIGAGAYALTLTKANKMIFIDRDFSSEVMKQAEDRIMRIGQKNSCIYYYLIMDHPAEDELTNILYRKEDTVNRTLDKLSNNTDKTITKADIIEKIIQWASESKI